MELVIRGLGKKYNNQWLFKNIDYTFAQANAYAITGHNGSGKSTLLQILLGYQSASAGSVQYQFNQQTIELSHAYKQIGFVAPYLELPEELTLLELIKFHGAFKKPLNIDITEMIEKAQLSGSEHKHIKYFSSGMKQRVKLLLALFSESSLLLLDEPCSNLDEQGISWYLQLMNEAIGNRTVVIASNQPTEYQFCTDVLNITHYKG